MAEEPLVCYNPEGVEYEGRGRGREWGEEKNLNRMPVAPGLL